MYLDLFVSFFIAFIVYLLIEKSLKEKNDFLVITRTVCCSLYYLDKVVSNSTKDVLEL
jgi:hypothetical protein